MSRIAPPKTSPLGTLTLALGTAMLLLSPLWSTGCSKDTPPETDGSAPAEQGAPADSASPDVPDPDGPVPDTLAPDMVPPAASLQAGVASVEIDFAPLVGVPLGGYGSRRNMDSATLAAALKVAQTGTCVDPDPSDVAVLLNPSVGTHDPITVRTLVLQTGTVKAAIVKIDAIGVDAKLRNDLAPYAQTLGIPPHNLLVTATHTHSGPGALTENLLLGLIAMDCFHQGAYDKMVGHIKASMDQADAKLAPARLGAGTVEVPDVTENRSGRPGVVDRELGLIRVEQMDGTPMAAVLNFAIHGTCAPEDDMLFSADVPGYTERALDNKLGVVTLFLNGAEGDITPAQGGYDGAEAIGNTLATAAETLWGSLTTAEEVVLAGTVVEEDLPPFELSCSLKFEDASLCDLVDLLKVDVAAWMPTSAPFGVLRIDDIVLSGVPGEPITDIGAEIKAAGAALGFRHTFVVGLANEHLGYVVTAAEYPRDEYESQMTMYGAGTGTAVVDALTARMTAVKP